MDSMNDARNGLLAMSVMCFMTGVALVLALTLDTPVGGPTDGGIDRQREEALRLVSLYYNTRQTESGR